MWHLKHNKLCYGQLAPSLNIVNTMPMPKLLTTTAVRLLLRCAAQPSARPPAAAGCTEQILQIQCFKNIAVVSLCSLLCLPPLPPPNPPLPAGALHSPPTIPGMDKMAEIDSLLVHFIISPLRLNFSTKSFTAHFS